MHLLSLETANQEEKDIFLPKRFCQLVETVKA